MKKGDTILVCGHYAKVTRDCSLDELTEYWGGFYGYQSYTGYPVFDTQDRVASGWASWVREAHPTRESAIGVDR